MRPCSSRGRESGRPRPGARCRRRSPSALHPPPQAAPASAWTHRRRRPWRSPSCSRTSIRRRPGRAWRPPPVPEPEDACPSWSGASGWPSAGRPDRVPRLGHPLSLAARRHSSVVEQLFRKQQVLGSNPSVGSTPVYSRPFEGWARRDGLGVLRADDSARDRGRRPGPSEQRRSRDQDQMAVVLDDLVLGQLLDELVAEARRVVGSADEVVVRNATEVMVAACRDVASGVPLALLELDVASLLPITKSGEELGEAEAGSVLAAERDEEEADAHLPELTERHALLLAEPLER